MDFATVVPPYVAKPLRLEPFDALMLAPHRVGDPASARAFARPYRAVAARLLEWERQGHLERDASPALYVHEYTAGGLTVRGLVGALDISRRATAMDDRAVWAHEGIHPDQVDDLADRMLEMGMNPAPILLAHRATPEVRAVVHAALDRPALLDYTDRAGQRQRIWAIRSDAALAAVAAGLAGTSALIADGHHRYAAYLRLQERYPGTGWDHGLAMLVDQGDTPLFLGPIHRTLDGTTLSAVLDTARRLGARAGEVSHEQALERLGPDTLVVTDGHAWATITPAPAATAARGSENADLGAEPVAPALVEWLHHQLLAALPVAPTVGFHHSAEQAVARAGAAEVAVLLPAPDYTAIRAIVTRGRLLPEKATSFQPKPSLGVLMRSVPDAPDAPH